MKQHNRQGVCRRRFTSVRLVQAAGLAISLGAALGPLLWVGRVQAQELGSAGPQAPEPAWQQCADLTGDAQARLSCFDRWAAQQPSPATANPASASTTPMPAAAPPASPPVVITMTAPAVHNCRNPVFTDLSRYWELEAGSDCGALSIRGYRPISLSWIGSDGVNTQPNSPTPEHTAATALPYSTSEVRLQLSVRTKLARGLLTREQTLLRDSVWFGYTQQSYWQLFNGELSRPFRSTDHEPELTYVYPTDAKLPGGWRLRYSGISLVHQSNGQALPLSRSWNRVVLMAGMERGHEFRLQGKVWKRLNEGAVDDDNPEISDLVGRAELIGTWDINKDNTVAMTLRHSLNNDGKGSVRLEWLTAVGDGGIPGSRNGLRFHTQLFSGYGDSLVDYNRRRTGLSLGLSLVEW